MTLTAVGDPPIGTSQGGPGTTDADWDQPTLVTARARAGRAAEPSSSTLLTVNRPAWLSRALSSIFRLASVRVAPRAFLDAAYWLTRLPEWVAAPSVGIGDDLSVSIEWDHGGKTLHVMFIDGSAEAYFEDTETGVEWEMQLGSTTDPRALVHALQSVSL
jgi:hypothetical protein